MTTLNYIFDHATGILAIVGFLATFISSYKNRNKLNALHIDLNSRLTQLLAVTSEAEHAKGIIAGRDLGVVEKDARTMESERAQDRQIAIDEKKPNAT